MPIRRQYLFRDLDGFSNPLQPVTGLAWWEALAYTKWAQFLYRGGVGEPAAKTEAKDRLELSLPTEVQWEALARWGGAKGACRARWPHGELNKATAALDINHLGTRWDRPSPVGVFSAGQNGQGVSDLAGNVWEWCANRVRENSYRTDAGQAEAGRHVYWEAEDDSRALRGGGCLDACGICRVASRYQQHPYVSLDAAGLRLVRCVMPHSGH